MGPSFAYLLPVLTIINDLADEEFSSEHETFLHTMRGIQGSLMISSFVNMILGFSRAWGDFTKFIVGVSLECRRKRNADELIERLLGDSSSPEKERRRTSLMYFYVYLFRVKFLRISSGICLWNFSSEICLWNFSLIYFMYKFFVKFLRIPSVICLWNFH